MRRRDFCWMLVLAISLPACDAEEGASSKAPDQGAEANPGPGVFSSARPDPDRKKALRIGARVPPAPEGYAPHEAPLELAKPTEKGSWKAVRPVAVFRRPDLEAPIRGAIKKFTRLPRVTRVKGAEGSGCPRGFLRLADQAYVCLKNLKKSRRPPRARRQPTLGANKLTPGTYGYIRTGGAKLYWRLADGYHDRKGKPIRQSDTVRWAGKRFYKKMKFWRITTGHFIRGDRVRRFWPSRMKSVDLRRVQPADRDRYRLPLVFMVSRRRRKIGEKIPPVDVHDAPRGKVIATLKRYTAWPVDDVRQGPEDRWYHVPDKGWVSSEMVRLARLTDPPSGLHPSERWIDVDLEEQTLVAYHGRAPVYVALVSAGVWKYPTPVGTFRIHRKMAEADMKAEPSSDQAYRVDHVPWTMYFKGGYALHGAYWHDGFGHARSHGCINLSPKDARVIYHFTRPALPDGWTRLDADEKHPGTVIRIRGKARKARKARKGQKAREADAAKAREADAAKVREADAAKAREADAAKAREADAAKAREADAAKARAPSPAAPR